MDDTCMIMWKVISKVMGISYMVVNIALLIMLEVRTFNKTDGIDQRILFTAIFAAILTQPMLQIVAALFLKSCNDTLTLCNKGQILRNISYEIFNIDKDEDVSNKGEVDNAQTANAGTSKKENIENPEKGTDTTENVKSMNQATKSYVDLNTLNEVQGDFANLTKAWIPVFLTVFVCEIIMLVNAGFVVSKNILNEIPFTEYQQDAYEELFIMVYFLFSVELV